MSEEEIADLEKRFGEGQERLIESFKEKVKSAADDAISALYTGIANYATQDAHINYYRHLQEEFEKDIIKEATTDAGAYSWGRRIRLILLEKHKGILGGQLVTDLQGKISEQRETIEELRLQISRRY
jgi:hypothetical protein